MDLKSASRDSSLPSFALPQQFSEADTAEWLALLPLANRDLSMDALLAFVKALNGQEAIACGERLGILERLWPAAETLVLQCSNNQMADSTFPLPQTAQRLAGRCFAMVYELGHGYRRVVTDPAFMSDWALGERERLTVLLRVMQHYGQALLRLKLCYQPSPCGFWRNVYEIYRLAETHHLLAKHAVEGGGRVQALAVHDYFLAPMLFALAPTNRHRPRDIRQIYALLQRFGSHANVASAWQSNGQTALFVFDMDSDREPHRVTPQDARGGAGLRFLYTRNLVDAMLAHFSTPAGMAEFGAGLSGGLLKRLVKSLGVPERRKARRSSDDAERVVIIGLKQIIQGLWHGRSIKEASKGRTSIQYKGVKWLDVPDFEVEDLPHPVAGGAERFVRSEHTLIVERSAGMSREDIWGERRFAGAQGGDDTTGLKAATINASAHGYCLLWTHKLISCLKVGELIGFPTGQGSLHVGVIRWLQQKDDGDVMLGVELIAPKTKAVSIYSSGRGAPEMALLLPEDSRLLREPSILVQTAKFNVGQAVTVDDASGLKNYRIDKLVESSPSFQQFILANDQDTSARLV